MTRFSSSGKCWRLLWNQSLVECIVAEKLNHKRLLTFHSGKKRKCRSSKPCKHCALSFKWNAYSSNYTYARYVVALQILSAAFMYVLLPQVKTILAMARSANSVQRETQARLHENDNFVQYVTARLCGKAWGSLKFLLKNTKLQCAFNKYQLVPPPTPRDLPNSADKH